MAFLTRPDILENITKGVELSPSGLKNEGNLLTQIDRMISFLRDEGVESEDDAKKIIVAGIGSEAVKQGGNASEVFQSLPNRARGKLVYTPEQLAINQEVTVKGTKIAITFFFASLIGAIATTLIAFKYVALLPAWARLPIQVAIPAIITAFLARMGWTVSTAVNNWNDVFHWGPLMGSQARADVQRTPSGVARETGIARVTKSKTGKPKIYLGTIFGGAVAPARAFVRQLDDEITSEDDLVNDIQINMTRWLATLPSKLTYEIQVKNNPFDANQVRKTGIWATLAIYVTNNLNKRSLVDEILLGPIQTAVYFPDVTHIETLSFNINSLLAVSPITPFELPGGSLFTVDEKGNVVTGFFKQGEVLPSQPASEVIKTIETPVAAGPVTPAVSAVQTTAVQPPVTVVQPAAVPPAPQVGALPIAGVLPQFITSSVSEAEKMRQQHETELKSAGIQSPLSISDSFPTGLNIEVANTAGRGANFRKLPGLKAALISAFPEGTRGKSMGHVTSLDGFTWLHADFNGVIGWVASHLVKRV